MTKTIESLADLFARTVDMADRKHDVLADTRRMSWADDGTLTLDVEDGVHTFAPSDHMRGQVSNDTGIPKRYFDRMGSTAPALLATNVNHWFASEPNRRMVRGYRTDDGTYLGRAFLSDGYRRLDNIDVVKKLLPEFQNIGTTVEFHQAAITDTKLYVRAIFPTMLSAVKVGDPVCWGVQITNSEVGSGTLGITGFVNRLACTNGMTVDRVLNKRHVGRRIEGEGVLSDEALAADDKAFWLAARDLLRAAISEARFNEVVEQLRETVTGEKIVAPIQATEVLQKQFSLTDEEREAVLASLVSEGDLTQWGALNAVTAAAKKAETFDRQAEMEAIGWEIANLSNTSWDKIALVSGR